MDKHDAPPPYPGPQELGNPVQQNSYSYSGQTNYGFSAQPAAQSNVIVTTVEWNSGAAYSVPPQDYTTSAWLACLCCFWPTGLMAIMKASESRDALARGDMVGAHAAANSARLFVRISFLAGLLSVIFAVVIVIIYATVLTSSINSYDD